jgi:hypothetical protein
VATGGLVVSWSSPVVLVVGRNQFLAQNRFGQHFFRRQSSRAQGRHPYKNVALDKTKQKTHTCAGLPDGFVFEPKNTDLGKFWWVLRWKMLVYFMAIRHIVQVFGIFYGNLVYFTRFGKLWQENSGNPARVCAARKIV